MATEPVPVSAVKSALDDEWNVANVDNTSAKPVFLEVNGPDDRLRFNLNQGDTVLIRAGTPSMAENFIGNYKYGNRIYNVEIELWTKNQRQRLYDLMREIRRSVHNTKHSLDDFQRWQVVNFIEPTNAQANIWTGSMTIVLENNSIFLET